MSNCPAFMIFVAFSLLLILQPLEVVNAAKCSGRFIDGNSSYGQNRLNLFSTLADKVVTNGGFYNASLGQNPNRVYALALCARGYEQEACTRCVEEATKDIQTDCPNGTDSFLWRGDSEDRVSCLVRSSNHSTLGNLELRPVIESPSPTRIDKPSINMILFSQQWEAMVNRTLEATARAETSSVSKYYNAAEAEFTEFANVYMLMQCTPDITSRDCKRCLEDCVAFYRRDFWGREGGMVSVPSCFFRWDLYDFHGAFDKVTRVHAPPRPRENGGSITNQKGRSIGDRVIMAVIVVYLLS